MLLKPLPIFFNKSQAIGNIDPFPAFLLPERRARPTSSFFRISSFQPRYHVKILSVTYIAMITGDFNVLITYRFLVRWL
ncbi:hypothetical protein P4S95_13115 [Aneurinibacillus aneurinilyticus]|uniref:hypothetical protein n=1 Tax=Aneurinibacillus aneurinilyticus TaxID=1391 RepID=UPI002E1E4E9B|nr:hypothetical protein [Aneurinibacillus aneurinilyticus]